MGKIYVGSVPIADETASNVVSLQDRITSLLGKVIHCKRINKVRYSTKSKSDSFGNTYTVLNNHYVMDKNSAEDEFVSIFGNWSTITSDDDKDFEV